MTSLLFLAAFVSIPVLIRVIVVSSRKKEPQDDSLTKQKRTKKRIAIVLIVLAVLFMSNHLYCAWRNDDRAIKDYLRNKEKTVIIRNVFPSSIVPPNVLSASMVYDIFFFDNSGHGFGYVRSSYTLYSHFSDKFTNQKAGQKDLIYIDVWIDFSEWGKIGDADCDTRAHIEFRNTENGFEIASLAFDLTKNSSGKLSMTTVSNFTNLGELSLYLNQEQFEAQGYTWAVDLINKTNAFCWNHESFGGWSLPRPYERTVSE